MLKNILVIILFLVIAITPLNAQETEREIKVKITDLYRELLKRNPDSGGLIEYTKSIKSGFLNWDSLREGMKNSEEYRNLHNLPKVTSKPDKKKKKNIFSRMSRKFKKRFKKIKDKIRGKKDKKGNMDDVLSGDDDPFVEKTGPWKVPDIVLYNFIFDTGHKLTFRTFSTADFWGGCPAAGWGQITNPDGTERGVNINSELRHKGTNGTVKNENGHGRKFYWVGAGKRIIQYEDGYAPSVENTVSSATKNIGLSGNIVRVKCTIEGRMNMNGTLAE